MKVVGVTFHKGYPQNLLDLAEIARARIGEEHEGLPAVLVRAKDNAHDPNAIEVHLPALGDEALVGHLPAPVAAWLAPMLDEGVTYRAEVACVLVAPGAEERPGIEVVLTRVDPCTSTGSGKCSTSSTATPSTASSTSASG